MSEFNFIYDLIEKCQYDTALNIILDEDTQCINAPFKDDLNHSWYVAGDIFYKKNDYEKAAFCFEKSLEAWEEDVEAMMALANSYSELDKADLSAKFLYNALLIKPKDSGILYNYANALFDLGEYEESIKYYNKVSKGDIEIYKMAVKNIKACNIALGLESI